MRLAALGLFLAVLSAVPAGAGPLSDLVMAPGLFAAAPEGPVLHYAFDRTLPAQAAGSDPAGAGLGLVRPRAVAEGEVTLTKAPGKNGPVLQLGLDEGQGPHVVAEFSPGGTNPVLLFFLENVVRNIAVQTGGSPFYIRNRIREALAAADTGTVSDGTATVVLQPFDADPNRPRMGEFAGLTLSLRYDPADPGRFVELLADTARAGGSYSEALRLIPEE